MREIRTSGLMSGDGRRGFATAPILDSTLRSGRGHIANFFDLIVFYLQLTIIQLQPGSSEAQLLLDLYSKNIEWLGSSQ
jgi:hypothetical protein